MAYEDARERYIARTQGGYPTRERTPRGLGSFKNKFRNIGRALKDEFGGSVMAGELRSDLDSTSGYLSGGSSLENLSKKQQADLFGTLGITPNTSVVPTSGGGINLDADFPQQTEDHSTDEYNRAILQDKNFRDPFMSSLIDRDYMVNYPDYYRSKPQYMDMGSDVFGPQSTIGPVTQGFIPREKSWWSNLNPMNWFNRGGIMSLRR